MKTQPSSIDPQIEDFKTAIIDAVCARVDSRIAQIQERIEKQEPPKRWLTPREAAAYLNVSTKLLEQWRLASFGPEFRRLGPRLVRYDRAALDAFAEQGDAS